MRAGRLAAVLAVATVAGPAAAQDPPCADDVAGAPVPGEESGRTDPPDGDSTLRQVGRGVLFVPKVVVDTALQPVRGGLWAWDRYQLQDLYYRVFFNDARTIGITPTLGYDYGYGVDGVYGGARFVHRDLFGEREHLAITAATGMMYHQVYSGELRSGDRFGKRFSMELDVAFEQRPQDPFYGVGNGDLTAMPASPIDVRTDDRAYQVRFRQQRERFALLADERVWRSLHLRPSAAISRETFGRSDLGMAIDNAYLPESLVGWNGVDLAYGELDVRWDGRDRVSSYEPRSVFATGSLVDAFGARVHRLDGGIDYWRYGSDLQYFVRAGEGPRVISLRLHGEGVTGSRIEVPFADLPALGGLTYLRGYPLDRFRDRFAAFGSAEYAWDLAARVQANVFVDAGRVYDAPGDLSLDHLRVGYGFGLEIHTDASFVMEASIASSLDGGLGFNLGFNPVYSIQDRVRKL